MTTDEARDRERTALLQEIEADARATAAYTGRDAFDPRVMAAIGRVPRHEFMPPSETPFAYYNNALPIGHGQTISQPYIVALMTDLLDLGDAATVLEVGTGSGYQAAVLAELAQQVYSIEIVEPLAEQAAQRLAHLGYVNVTVRSGDGYGGWPEHAPYDGILVTAAAETVPPPLIAQLKPGAHLVIPVARGYLSQDLVLVEKDEAGGIHQRVVLPVAFVPLTGGHGADTTPPA